MNKVRKEFDKMCIEMWKTWHTTFVTVLIQSIMNNGFIWKWIFTIKSGPFYQITAINCGDWKFGMDIHATPQLIKTISCIDLSQEQLNRWWISLSLPLSLSLSHSFVLRTDGEILKIQPQLKFIKLCQILGPQSIFIFHTYFHTYLMRL